MKKLNLQLFAMILFGLLSSGLFAQISETSRNKELSLNGNLLTFNNFGLQYKSELKSGNYFRLGITDIVYDITKQDYGTPMPTLPSTNTVIAGTFEIGLEKRTQITNKLTAFYGVNFTFTSSFHRNKRPDPSLPLDSRHLDNLTVNPGFGFNSGFIYKISDEFSVSTEIVPRLLYTYSTSQRVSGLNKVNDTTQGASFNLDNQSVRVSLIYSWTKD